MSGELAAAFTKRHRGGATVRAELRQPADRFSVTVLFGPSGCGKTTLLRCLAGLDAPDEGRIEFAGRVWFDAAARIALAPQDRDVGFLFQEYALFPHLSVAENVGYGLRRAPPAERAAQVAAMLERMNLTELAARRPAAISGGERQRTALGRALARRPRLLLLDEPLAALDAGLRTELRRRLRDLLTGFGIPTILVTHDRTEAMALADRIVVMDRGAIRQQGTVAEVFQTPRDLAVARIVGIETVAPGEVTAVTAGLATVSVAGRLLTAVAPEEPLRRVHVCIKGEDVILQRAPHSDQSVRNQLSARVTSLVPEGALVRVGLDCGFELSALVTRPACEELRLAIGETVTAGVKAPSIHLIERRSSSAE